jgi:hypothetical protein
VSLILLSEGGRLTIHALRYKNDPEIAAMTGLVDAYQRREVHAAEKILRGRFPLLPSYTVVETKQRSP